MPLQSNNWGRFYFLLVILEIIAEVVAGTKGDRSSIYLIKPALMPMLMVWLVWAIKPNKPNLQHKLILAALFFSWLGDIFLMIYLPDVNLFLPGLGAFLLAHLFYIVAFSRTPDTNGTTVKWPAVFILLYGVILVYGLYTYGNADFQEMKIPVIVYAAVILIMVIFAIFRNGKVNDVSFKLVLIGALLFMFSDSMIALNRFTETFGNDDVTPRILIMATYTIAQFMIVKGIIRQSDPISSI